MKKLLTFFGILDLVSVATATEFIITSIKTGKIFNPANLTLTILCISFIMSGLLLLRVKRTGLWIYYVQFSCRLLYYAGLSFGFLMLFGRLFPDNKTVYEGLFVLCVVLEIARLVTTITIHKKYFAKKTVTN